MSNLRDITGRSYCGGIKISAVRMRGNNGIDHGHYAEVQLNGERVVIFNLGKRRIFVKGCEE